MNLEENFLMGGDVRDAEKGLVLVSLDILESAKSFQLKTLCLQSLKCMSLHTPKGTNF